MKSRFMLCMLAFCVALPFLATQTLAVEIVPVWEHLTNSPNGIPGFPILRAQAGTHAFQDTTSDLDLIGSITRYDEDRLLLLITENGIDESDPNHDADLAARFPDRCIWWLNDGDGSPLGIALDFPLLPYPDTAFYIGRIDGTAQNPTQGARPDLVQEQAPKIDVDTEGNLYLSDKHHLLRYTPNGDGTFSGPTMVFEYPQQEPGIYPDGTPISAGHFRAWAMRDLQIYGAGPNKVMTTTARHWIDGGGQTYYTTNDGGLTWNRLYVNFAGGGGSLPITNTDFAEEYTFSTAFPGNDGGRGNTRIRRYVRPLDSTDPFQEDLADFFDGYGVDPNSEVANAEKWVGYAKTDIAAYPGVDYAVVYSMPLWQSAKNETEAEETAWLGLISVTADPNADGKEGDFVTAHRINFNEADEPGAADEDNSDPWRNVYASEVKIKVGQGYAPGAFEILWAGGSIGYGRYIVGDTEVSEWSLY